MDQRATAEEEWAAWCRLSTAEKVRYDHTLERYWHAHGRSQSQVRNRRTLLRAGSDALWRAVEGGLSLTTAVKIVRDAALQGQPIEAVLQAYGTDKILVRQVGGGYAYRRATKPIEPIELDTVPPLLDTVQPLPLLRPQMDERSAWEAIRTAIYQLAVRSLAGEDTMPVEELLLCGMIEVKLVLADLRNKLRNAGKNTATRGEIIKACHILGVQPPKPGARLDPNFRKRGRRLQYEYHEDRLGASYNKERFLAVDRALQLLKEYDSMFQEQTHG